MSDLVEGEYDVIATADKTKKSWNTPYKWYGMNILTAKCAGKDYVGYEAQINIMGIIVLAMVALLAMLLVFKMMKKEPPQPSLLQV